MVWLCMLWLAICALRLIYLVVLVDLLFVLVAFAVVC